MNNEIEQTGNNPYQRMPDIVKNLNEQLENARIVREMLELHAANEQIVPLKELREKPPDEPSDDTLSRLERLSNPPKKEYHEELIGGIYQLTEEAFLIILKDGTIMKIVAIDDDKRLKPSIQEAIRKLYQQQEISLENLFNKIKKDPQSPLALFGVKIEYRTDDTSLEPEQIRGLVEEDLKNASNVVNAKKERKEKNTAESLKAIVSSPLNPFSRNETTDE